MVITVICIMNVWLLFSPTLTPHLIIQVNALNGIDWCIGLNQSMRMQNCNEFKHKDTLIIT